MEQVHLETKDLSYTYHDGTQALKKVNIKIKKGEKVAIMGPNGAGVIGSAIAAGVMIALFA